MMPHGELPPLSFAPIYKEKVWGGSSLKRLLGAPAPGDVRIGESWELSGFGADISHVSGGPYAGQSLSDLLRTHGSKLAGAAVSAEAFPLLYKFIDAQDNLSVQVHPDDAQAQAQGWGQFGKTECWYVVHADPGAQAISGFKRRITPAEVEERIRKGTLEEALNFIDIAAGEVIFIPARTIHATLKGAVLYEVQESSDTTLRFYDWNRNDPGRKLHVAESVSVVDWSVHDRHKIAPVTLDEGDGVAGAFRVACRYFALMEYRLDAGARLAIGKRQSFQVISLLGGEIEVASAQGDAALARGRTLLLPAALERVEVAAPRPAHLLLSWVPDLNRDVIEPLRARGIAGERIGLLGGNPACNDLLPLLG